MATILDHLKLSSHPGATKMLEENGDEKEFFVYSKEVIKVNRKGKKQTRALAITNKAVYNMDKKVFKTCKRRIPLWDIVQITLSNASDEFVLHVPTQYDYIYMSADKTNIAKILKQQRKKTHGYAIDVKYTQKKNLFNIAQKKPELGDQKSVERCNDCVLQPWKIHQTKHGRVIQLPKDRRYSGDDHTFRQRLTKRKDGSMFESFSSLHSLQTSSMRELAISSSRLDNFDISMRPSSERVETKKPSKSVRF